MSLLVKIIHWSTPCLISIFDGRCQTAFWLSLFLSKNTNLIYGDFSLANKWLLFEPFTWFQWTCDSHLVHQLSDTSFYFSITLSMDRLLLSFCFFYNQSGLSFRPLLSRSLMRLFVLPTYILRKGDADGVYPGRNTTSVSVDQKNSLAILAVQVFFMWRWFSRLPSGGSV